MKKIIPLLFLFFLFTSCLVKNNTPKNTVKQNITVTEITEGGIKDIVFYYNDSDFYYINRGLENGLNLDSLNAKVLNKTVTLHLAKLIGGATSEHIAQLALGDEIIYTEFTSYAKASEDL